MARLAMWTAADSQPFRRNVRITASGCRIINDNIVICGIAGDFCVKESIKNLLKHWRFNIEVFMDGIASIDGGTALKELINERGLKQI